MSAEELDYNEEGVSESERERDVSVEEDEEDEDSEVQFKRRGKKRSRSASKSSPSKRRKRSSRSSSDSANTELFEQLQDYLDEKFERMRKELSEENQEIARDINKRLKRDDYTFQKKGNKIQYEVNRDVYAKIKDADAQLDRKSVSTRNIQKASASIREGMEMLIDRNKLILLADSSEGGWETVNQYTRKCIAVDSDDDRRMRKADQSALKVIEQKKKKRPFYQRRWQNNYNYNNNNNYRYQQQDNQSFRAQRNPYYVPRRPSINDICFGCGRTGHWKRACPATAGPSAAQGAPDNNA